MLLQTGGIQLQSHGSSSAHSHEFIGNKVGPVSSPQLVKYLFRYIWPKVWNFMCFVFPFHSYNYNSDLVLHRNRIIGKLSVEFYLHLACQFLQNCSMLVFLSCLNMLWIFSTHIQIHLCTWVILKQLWLQLYLVSWLHVSILLHLPFLGYVFKITFMKY